MPIGHKRPSETFREAVSTIERNRMTEHAIAPVTAPMSAEINHGLRNKEQGNERQGIEGERTQEKISVPIVENPTVSAESGTSSSDWKERIEAMKKAKHAKVVVEPTPEANSEAVEKEQ